MKKSQKKSRKIGPSRMNMSRKYFNEIRSFEKKRKFGNSNSNYQSISKPTQFTTQNSRQNDKSEFEFYRSEIRIQKDRELKEKKIRLKEELLNKYSTATTFPNKQNTCRGSTKCCGRRTTNCSSKRFSKTRPRLQKRRSLLPGNITRVNPHVLTARHQSGTDRPPSATSRLSVPPRQQLPVHELSSKGS